MQKNMIQGFELKTKKTERWGRFTFCYVQDSEGRTAVGISKRSCFDPMNDKKGKDIAEGRALKALKMKQEGKRVPNNSVYMG